ncbi:hypothetical protein M2267_003017 [Ensifer sp. KUDG1]|uniref:hypothetical protein n=1 Tax=Ensifer sp. KUDG1 TaxID=3373919 RepID=UPI003D2395DB
MTSFATEYIAAPDFVKHDHKTYMKPKRYALFAWPHGRPKGGWEDLRGSAGTSVEALAGLEEGQREDPAQYACWQIIDLRLGRAMGFVNERSSGGLMPLHDAEGGPYRDAAAKDVTPQAVLNRP